MFRMNGKLALNTQQLKIIQDGEAAEIEGHVVIGAQTKDIRQYIRTVVWGAQGLNVCCLRVGAGIGFDAQAADLAGEVSSLIDPGTSEFQTYS